MRTTFSRLVRAGGAALALGFFCWVLAFALPVPTGTNVHLQPIRDRPDLYDPVQIALYDSNPRKYEEWGELIEIDWHVFAAEVDLDDDGVKEVIVRFESTWRADGRFTFVLRNIDGHWTEVCSFLEHGNSLRILNQTDFGQRRIRTTGIDWNYDFEHKSATNYHLIIRWQPDGRCQPVPNSTIGVRPIEGH